MEPNNVENDGGDYDWKPRVRMTFDTEQEAFDFYNAYGGRLGFSIRKGYVNKSKEGQITSRQFLSLSLQSMQTHHVPYISYMSNFMAPLLGHVWLYFFVLPDELIEENCLYHLYYLDCLSPAICSAFWDSYPTTKLMAFTPIIYWISSLCFVMLITRESNF
ncbi:hypothetical protein ACSBR1_007663 [Camellia fascicularis]